MFMLSVDPDLFGRLTAVRRVWAIGAIHGDCARLRRLHQELENRFAPGDRFVYLGNYLGWGDDIPGTLDELLLFRRRMLVPGMEPEDFVYLRGAQEEMWRKLLQLQFAPAPGEVFDWMMAQGVEATLKAYGGTAQEGRSLFREGALAITRWTNRLREAMQRHPGHDDLLSSIRRAAYTENGRVLFVHAGLDPNRPLSEQGDTLWWGSGYFTAIEQPYGEVTMIARGYDRTHKGLAMTQHTTTVDAGCGFGGRLAAACFDPQGKALDWIEV